jgi:hypothetical protein
MSKRRNVLLALKAGITECLPLAKVRGFDGDTSRPERISAHGDVVGHPGTPGDPEMDLSPLRYHYDHVVTLEVAPPPGGDQSEQLDAMLVAIGDWVETDRTLGGLCSWLEARAADEDDVTPSGAASQRWAVVDLVASYTTTNPLN